MLTDEFKKAAMEKLNAMTAEDFIKAFERIGSEKTSSDLDLDYIITKELYVLSLIDTTTGYSMLRNAMELESTIPYPDSENILLAA